ncbi:MAG TPA: hypothetical protein VK983_04170 [Candidatus Limnocylindrales bacterium]|nr:hypothetical protein [Candidatus Limnocylindrales bacterium]
MSKTTICIKYGIGEGDWHGRRFKKALKRAGFKVTLDALRVDIIVSHSGGCFFLPQAPKEQMIVLINPPYWPGKPLALSAFQKIWWDYKAFAARGKRLGWYFKTMWNCVHLVRYLGKSWTISLSARKHNFHEALHHDTVVIIRNDQDAWCTPHIQEQLHPGKTFHMHRMPGQHDDCWANPEPYVQVIQSEVTQDRKQRP